MKRKGLEWKGVERKAKEWSGKEWYGMKELEETNTIKCPHCGEVILKATGSGAIKIIISGKCKKCNHELMSIIKTEKE